MRIETAEQDALFGGVFGPPITWFFAIVVLMLLLKAIPLAKLPVIRFPTTVVLRAPRTSIRGPLPFNHEAPDREAGNAHIAHARPGELAGIDVHVA